MHSFHTELKSQRTKLNKLLENANMGLEGHWFDEYKNNMNHLPWPSFSRSDPGVNFSTALLTTPIKIQNVGVCFGGTAFSSLVERLVGKYAKEQWSCSGCLKMFDVLFICHPSVFVLFVQFCHCTQWESGPALLLWRVKLPAPAVDLVAAKIFWKQKLLPQTVSEPVNGNIQ